MFNNDVKLLVKCSPIGILRVMISDKVEGVEEGIATRICALQVS